MIDANDYFGADVQTAVEQEVITGVHETGQAIFDGRENHIRRTIFNRVEKRFEGRPRRQSNFIAEQF
jgi:hypothetical protein